MLSINGTGFPRASQGSPENLHVVQISPVWGTIAYRLQIGSDLILKWHKRQVTQQHWLPVSSLTWSLSFSDKGNKSTVVFSSAKIAEQCNPHRHMYDCPDGQYDYRFRPCVVKGNCNGGAMQCLWTAGNKCAAHLTETRQGLVSPNKYQLLKCRPKIDLVKFNVQCTLLCLHRCVIWCVELQMWFNSANLEQHYFLPCSGSQQAACWLQHQPHP